MGKLSFLSSSLLIVSLWAQLSQSHQQRRIDPALQAQIDTFIQNFFLPAAGSNGMVIAIVQDDGELLYTNGFGHANIEKEIPNTNNTQFILGSISKSFTAVLTAKLLHETFPDLGEAVLDTPIRKLVPDVNFTLIDRYRSEHVTFRDLLSHQHCIFDQPVMAEPFESTEEALFRSRYNHAECDLRNGMSYSNQMITMAGVLSSHLVNKSYEDAMQDLWNDMGMTGTTFLQPSDNFTEMTNRAMPYYKKDEQVYLYSTTLLKRIKVVNAAGGIYVTPNDMIKYMSLFLNFGKIDGKQVIPQEVMKWFRKPSGIIAFEHLNSFKEKEEDIVFNQFAYGLAVVLGSYDGWENIDHGGFYPPYVSYMSLFPGKNLGIYSSLHMTPFNMHPIVLQFAIFEMLRGTSMEKVMEKVTKLNMHFKANQLKEANESKKNWQNTFQKAMKLQKVSKEPVPITLGQYGSGSAGELEISERFNPETNMTQYFIDYGKWYKGWLEPVEGQVALYKALWVTEVVQDDDVVQIPEHRHFVIVGENDTLTVLGITGEMGTFKLGVSLDKLPLIPWDPDSC